MSVRSLCGWNDCLWMFYFSAIGTRYGKVESGQLLKVEGFRILRFRVLCSEFKGFNSMFAEMLGELAEWVKKASWNTSWEKMWASPRRLVQLTFMSHFHTVNLLDYFFSDSERVWIISRTLHRLQQWNVWRAASMDHIMKVCVHLLPHMYGDPRHMEFRWVTEVQFYRFAVQGFWSLT